MKKVTRTALLLTTALLLASIVAVAALKAPDAPETAASRADASRLPASTATVSRGMHVVDVSDVSEPASEPDYTGARLLVERNTVFGDALYDEEALLDAVEILLLDRSVEVDGFRYLDRTLVADTIKAMYGRTLSEDAGPAWEPGDPEGSILILPRGYGRVEHAITDIAAQPDGTLTVTSLVVMVMPDSTEMVEATTTLSPADNEYGYVITAATLAD